MGVEEVMGFEPPQSHGLWDLNDVWVMHRLLAFNRIGKAKLLWKL